MSCRNPKAPLVWVTEAPDRVVALITGKGDVRGVLTAAGISNHAKWSPSGGGWCIPSAQVADFVAWCEWRSVACRCRTLTTIAFTKDDASEVSTAVDSSAPSSASSSARSSARSSALASAPREARP